jgi:large subunit ribosomal protein L6
MSRIGNLPVTIPSGTTVSVTPTTMSVKGPKGQLFRVLPSHVSVEVVGALATVSRVNDSKPAKARHGLTRALLQNMVIGVTVGFERKLEIVGVGYKAAVKGRVLELQLGYSHPIVYDLPDGIDAVVVKGTNISLTGIDKEVLGQAAANVRGFRKPDAYKGKGIRYAGERIKLKPGKAGSVA